MKNFTLLVLTVLCFFFSENAMSQNEFITTWKTDNPGTSNDDQITIPIGTGTFNYTVDWGDGNIESGLTANATHTYAVAGTYTVKISGQFPHLNFFNGGDQEKILSVEEWGTNQWGSMEAAFAQCSNLVINAIDAPDLSLVTSMKFMFIEAAAFNQPINNWDVSNVTDMSYMFRNATLFNQPLSSWDVSNVTDMQEMFNSASSFNQDISGWNVGQVTTIRAMFLLASAFNQSIGAWNVSNVTDMSNTFNNSSFNQDISSWNVANVTNMSGMFGNTNAFNQDISGWIVSSVTNMSGMFSDATAFNQDISSWNVANVNTMWFMFNRALSFNQDISGWSVNNVTNMENMFSLAIVFNQDISGWAVNNVTTMGNMFSNAFVFNQDLGSWDISSVSNMTNMFLNSGLSLANYDNTLIGWNTLDTVNGETQIPTGITFNGGTSMYCDGEVARDNLINTYSWTIADGGLDCPIDFTNAFITTWKTDNNGDSGPNQIIIPIGDGVFNYSVDWGDGTIESGFTADATHTYASAGTYTVKIIGQFPHIQFPYDDEDFDPTGDNEKILSVEQWGNNQWASMQASFAFCYNLEINAIDAPDLSMVTDMSYMFIFTQAFNQSINHWDVSNVTNMEALFAVAVSFNQNISSWDVSNVTNMSGMFANATNFNDNISSWDVSSVSNMSYMFQGASSFNGNISSWDVSSAFTMEGMFFEATSFDQDLGSWDISNITDMSDMFLDASLSLANYDNTLIGWNTLDTAGGETQIPTGVTFNGGTSVYCNGETARTNLINTNSWSINDSGLDCSTLSITHNTINSIKLFPNPVTKSFTIKGLANTETHLEILNIQGQVVKTLTYHNAQKVSIEALANGMYFVNIFINNEQKNIKIIKQ